MTTAFTAIPMKITTSAIRVLEFDMAESYPMKGCPVIDLNQVHQQSMGLKNA